jgi:predicted DNA-binding mobile mystery protein A
MMTPAEQLDRRFEELRPWLSKATRPPQGWLKAIREGLGLTTRQMAGRMGFSQSRVSKMEAAEAHGEITLKSLEKAASTLGCQVVYVIVPREPLTQTLKQQARKVALQQLEAVSQTMRLEAQELEGSQYRKKLLQQTTEKLLARPSKLWNAT